MEKKLSKIINILIFLKYLSPVIALLHLFGWIMQGTNKEVFALINFLCWPLPTLFDKILNIHISLFGIINVSMGYAYTACLFISFYYLSNILIAKLQKVYEKYHQIEVQKRQEQQEEYRKKRLEEIKRQKKENPKIVMPALPEDRKVFFGLFEFNLSFVDTNRKDDLELDKLKQEFSKILVKKLKEGFPKVKFFSEDKIFFICDEFSNFGTLTKNILTLFKTFMQTGMMQQIKIGMLFSYWMEKDKSKKKTVFNILNKINELGYYNKIIVSSSVYYRFQREEDSKYFEFEPMGPSRLFNALGNEDIDVDLYSIIKVE